MKYSIEEIQKKIFDTVDVIYVSDITEDKYTALRTDSFFSSLLGEEGSYQDMMNTFMERSIDKKVAASNEYSVFFKEAGIFAGRFSKKCRFSMNGTDRTVHITNIPFEETMSAILINYVEEEAYISESRADEKVNTIKSAYLFSMCCDLVKDTCSNMDMSEVDDNPVNELNISFTQWRGTIVNMIWPDDQQAFNEFTDPEFLKANLDYHRSRSIDCQMINLEGQYIWVKLIFNRIETGDDSDFRVVFVVEDIHESHQRLVKDLKKYETMAMKDSLTGLLNHGHIESALTESLEKCRGENKPVSLILLDIDHFKRVNDTYGHATGDAVLKKFSALSRDHLKQYGVQLGRWGGEEFLGIFENTDGDMTEKIAEELRSKTEQSEFETVGKITCSIGVIQVNEDEAHESAFVRLDSALYRAKENGRNRVVRG